MGIKKFFVENVYYQYMLNYFGFINVFMVIILINYYFEVFVKFSNDEELFVINFLLLLGVLDCFVQFFIELLFLENILDCELRVVDLENKKNFQSDNWCLY